jgi:hypothetical protein
MMNREQGRSQVPSQASPERQLLDQLSMSLTEEGSSSGGSRMRQVLRDMEDWKLHTLVELGEKAQDSLLRRPPLAPKSWTGFELQYGKLKMNLEHGNLPKEMLFELVVPVGKDVLTAAKALRDEINDKLAALPNCPTGYQGVALCTFPDSLYNASVQGGKVRYMFAPYRTPLKDLSEYDHDTIPASMVPGNVLSLAAGMFRAYSGSFPENPEDIGTDKDPGNIFRGRHVEAKKERDGYYRHTVQDAVRIVCLRAGG